MNVTAALVAYLRADAGVSRLVGDRVFGPPGRSPRDPLRSEMESWGPYPRKTVVLMAAGGAGDGRGARSRMQWVENRFDIKCYAETPYQADLLHDPVYRAMVGLAGFTEGDTRLVTAEVGGGPLPGRDPDADWSFTLGCTWSTLSTDRRVSSWQHRRNS